MFVLFDQQLKNQFCEKYKAMIMRLIKKPVEIPKLNPFIQKIVYLYHYSDLMSLRFNDHKIKIYPPALELYASKFLNSPFNQRIITSLMVDLSRGRLSNEKFSLFIQFFANNAQKVRNFQTISTALTLMYLESYRNEEVIDKIVKKGFQLYNFCPISQKTYSFYSVRFLIAIDQIRGLNNYSNEQYNFILIDKFKPLFLVFVIEMFWKNGLQQKFDMPQKALKILIQNQRYIPYSDIHHMLYARKTIKDPRFQSIVRHLHERMVTHSGSSLTEEKNIDKDLIDEMLQNYKHDLFKKYI